MHPLITTEVASIAQIEARAKEAAQIYEDLVEACPYPFHSTSAYVFAKAFEAARAELKNPVLAAQPTEKALTKTAPAAQAVGRGVGANAAGGGK